MTIDKSNVGLIGLGNVSRFILNGIDRVPGLNLASVMDKDEGKRKGVPEERINFYSEGEMNSFLNSVDLVVIATPPHLHKSQAIEALNAGKHVLCEKPISIRFEDAQEMISTARKNNRVLMVPCHQRYNPQIEELIKDKRYIDSISSVELKFLEDIAEFTQNSWIFEREKSGGGCIMDSGINAVDCLETILGPIQIEGGEISYKDKMNNSLNVETSAEIYFQFRNGTGRMKISWVADTNEFGIVLKSPEGERRIDFNYDLGINSQMYIEYQRIFSEFLSLIHSEGRYEETRAIRNLKMVETIYKLAKDER
ncbi:hypothetical protein COU60_00740 [Candidatus Pacearchaeota archaeon CG10_big_fil_rev_8_21_14_0_10_34_76]|nr:MAG: hypothetical protein COU60_00740 [Candidatus Pacearchaeota archaeon CG10_big_fil_rev_8_21_14_0_10_34_76]